MVTLKNPLAGFGAGEGAPLRPAYYDRPELLARLDARLRDGIRAALAETRGRVLIVGGQWPELALELAAQGRFVTVATKDTEALRLLGERVVADGLIQQVNLDARDYGDIAYEGGSFETIVLYDLVPYLGVAPRFFAKCRRELRAGGVLLARVPVSVGAPFPDAVAGGSLTVSALDVPAPSERARKVAAARDRVFEKVQGLLAAARLAVASEGDARDREAPALPEWSAIEEALSAQLVLTKVDADHVLSDEVALLAATLRGPLRKLAEALLGPALELDGRLVANPAARPYARTLLVHATRQRELGKVFVLPGRGT